VRIQALCVYRKIATQLRRDGAESVGFVEGVADNANTAHHQGKDLFVFNDIDLKRVEGSSALIGERTSWPNAYSGATIRPALRGAKVKFKRG